VINSFNGANLSRKSWLDFLMASCQNFSDGISVGQHTLGKHFIEKK
jgi:hypothetical protein